MLGPSPASSFSTASCATTRTFAGQYRRPNRATIAQRSRRRLAAVSVAGFGANLVIP